MIMRYLTLAVCCFFSLPGHTQSDTVVLSNGDEIVGEIKDMTKGVLTIETDYSDSDFKIEWEKFRGIKSLERYTIN